MGKVRRFAMRTNEKLPGDYRNVSGGYEKENLSFLNQREATFRCDQASRNPCVKEL